MTAACSQGGGAQYDPSLHPKGWGSAMQHSLQLKGVGLSGVQLLPYTEGMKLGGGGVLMILSGSI